MLLWIATAAALDLVEGADTAGAGSAAVASPASNAAITANPALIASDERYTFSGAFSYGERGLHWSFGAVDAEISPIALGVVYSGDRYHPAMQTADLPGWDVVGQEVTNRKRYDDLSVSVGMPFAKRKFSLGIGGALSFYNHDRQGKGVTGNLSAGLAFRPDRRLSIGLAGRNLLPVNSPGRELELVGGVWAGEVGVGGFTVEGGARLAGGDPLLLAAGGEAWAGNAVALRAGWRLKEATHHATLGVGFGSHDASLDLAAQAPLNALGRPGDWVFMLSFRFQAPDIRDVQPD